MTIVGAARSWSSLSFARVSALGATRTVTGSSATRVAGTGGATVS
jgi:hypothetical protein